MQLVFGYLLVPLQNINSSWPMQLVCGFNHNLLPFSSSTTTELCLLLWPMQSVCGFNHNLLPFSATNAVHLWPVQLVCMALTTIFYLLPFSSTTELCLFLWPMQLVCGFNHNLLPFSSTTELCLLLWPMQLVCVHVCVCVCVCVCAATKIFDLLVPQNCASFYGLVCVFNHNL